MGPITFYREVLINLAGKLREEAVPVGGLPVPIFERNVKEYVQALDNVQESEEQELARIGHPSEPRQADKRGSLALAVATAMGPGKTKRARRAYFEGCSANSAREDRD